MTVALLTIFSLVSLSLAKSCTPTPVSELGPIYLKDPPYKTEICAPASTNVILQSNEIHPWLYRDSISLKRPTSNVKVSGRVLSTKNCEPLAGAEIDVWQADSMGTYGPVANPTEEERGFCRGVVKASKDGSYFFTSQEPGAYGSTRVLFGKLVPDLPPFGPRHFHITVYHPTHHLSTFQLYFPDDPAREEDWRATIAGSPLGSMDELLTLNVSADGEANFDFILEPLSDGETQPNSRTEALLARCPTHNPPAPALCYPKLANFFFRAEAFVGLMAVLGFLLYSLISRILCNSTKKATLSPKRKTQ